MPSAALPALHLLEPDRFPVGPFLPGAQALSERIRCTMFQRSRGGHPPREKQPHMIPGLSRDMANLDLSRADRILLAKDVLGSTVPLLGSSATPAVGQIDNYLSETRILRHKAPVMSSSSPQPESWIASFCGLLGHEYFAEVSEDFIEDDFNLTGLQSQVPMYKEALEMILDVEPDEEDEEDEEEDEEDEEDDILDSRLVAGHNTTGEKRHGRMPSDLSVIESSAEMLYGLIHQRYICSRPGIQQMAEKYELQHFGVCPRTLCNGCKVLPAGTSDILGLDTVKLFCPSCNDIYVPPNSRFQSVDGAYFGKTFCHLFFMTFPELDIRGRSAEAVRLDRATRASSDPSIISVGSSSDLASSLPPQPALVNGVPTANLAPGLGSGNIYESKIYGFRVAEIARSGPRMKWLREKPDDINELDEARKHLEMHGPSDGEEDPLPPRRKAPIRKRKPAAAPSTDTESVNMMDTNGIDNGG
jgi:casein kinase II subunit beta